MLSLGDPLLDIEYIRNQHALGRPVDVQELLDLAEEFAAAASNGEATAAVLAEAADARRRATEAAIELSKWMRYAKRLAQMVIDVAADLGQPVMTKAERIRCANLLRSELVFEPK